MRIDRLSTKVNACAHENGGPAFDASNAAHNLLDSRSVHAQHKMIQLLIGAAQGDSL